MLKMSSSKLIRLSGLAALVGGALLVVLNILETVFFSGQTESASAATGAWMSVEVAMIVAEILLTLGLIGLYLCQADQTGSLGLIGFVVAVTGTVMASGTDWSAAFFAPWLADTSPEILDSDPSGVFIAGIMLTFLLLVLGYLLFGLASLRAKVLPGGASVLLMVGAVVFLVLSLINIPFEAVIFGLAMAWMGYAVWSGAGEPELKAAPAV
jgi:hypothetical protein